MANIDTSEWNVNTDIYDIVESVKNLKKRYIEDENEDTLALGIFGFISDTEAKKIQTSTIMAGQMGNEMFPTRAKLTKNVITHAIYNNITDINAVPAKMTINMGIKVEDLDLYMDNGRFVLDCESPIFIEDYEFHFEYDIIIQRSAISNGTAYAYSAHYDMSVPNRVSNITEPYLKQPFTIRIGNYYYVVFQASIRQYTIEETSDKLISDSVIENKTFTFEFENQLVDFDVYSTYNGVTTRLKPLLYGSDYADEENYCWYLFISDNTVRISFDAASYTPGTNADILVKAYTSLGENGNFSYKNIDSEDAGLYVDMSSKKYKYNTITCYMVAVTNSLNGSNKKTKEELQKLIPKMAHSRGSITTDQDLLNYFDLLNTDTNRLIVKKKIDNQIARVWYAYFLLKQANKDVMPTDTINLKIITDPAAGQVIKGEDGRYILPAGTSLCLDGDSELAEVIDPADIPTRYSDEFYADNKYYYMTLYNTIINPNPLYAAYYLTSSNSDQYFTYHWVNENCLLQFVANKCKFTRSLLTEQSEYKLRFKSAQSISEDYGMVEVDEETGEIISTKLKAIIVIYKDDVPYRWEEAELVEWDSENFVGNWELIMNTDNSFDTENNINIGNINPMNRAGYPLGDRLYGYFTPNTKTVIYLLAEFDQDYGRYDLDQIAPGYNTYSVCNVYDVESGLDFYVNFTSIVNTRVVSETDTDAAYDIYGVPVVGSHYASTEDNINFLLNAIKEKKQYINDCLLLLENNMDIDFKFFNTYGPSLTYVIDKEAVPLVSIGHVDLSMNFKVKVRNTADVYIKDDITKFIKQYIENLEKIGDLHIPNLITDVTNNFNSRIVYIEFVNFNDFDLAIQHIVEKDNYDIYTVPEFLNIRNKLDDKNEIVPCINLEILYS